MQKWAQKQTGFTIVELLIVVVVIAILAAITIVAYNGVRNRAVASTLQNDLSSAIKQIKLQQVDTSTLPTVNDCSASPPTGAICLKSSNNVTLSYARSALGNQDFCVTATSGEMQYHLRGSGSPMQGPCLEYGLILQLDATNSQSYAGSGTTWSDISGDGNHGTLVNGVSYTNQNGGALVFDGVDDYVSSVSSKNYVDIVAIFEPDFSLNNSSAAAITGLVSAGTTNDRSLRFALANGTGPWRTNNPGNANDWAQTATSYNVNGVSSTSTTLLRTGWNFISGYRTNQTNFPANFTYHLGTGYPGRYYKGKIALLLMFNRQLTDDERMTYYNAYKDRYGF